MKKERKTNKDETSTALKNEVAPLLIGVRNDIKEVTDVLGEFVSDIEKIKGKDGITPEKDVDYLSKETTLKLIEDNTPKKGINYFTDSEIKEFLKQVTPRKGIDYKDGENGVNGLTPEFDKEKIIETILAKATPVKGIHYRDGIDGETKTIIEYRDFDIIKVRDGLESLTGNNRLSVKAIKGIEKLIQDAINGSTLFVPMGGGGGGGSTGGTPALPFNSIQYNNSGAFGGDANFLRFDVPSVSALAGVTLTDDFSTSATGYGIRVVPTSALGTTYGFYSDVVGNAYEFQVGYGGYFSATFAETNYGIYAKASGGFTNYAGYFDGDVQINGQQSTTGIATIASASPFGDGNFDILKFGNDSNGIFANVPFRLFWDDSNGYLTFDDGASGLGFFRSNFNGDYISGTFFTGGSYTGTSSIMTGADINATVSKVKGTNATVQVYITSFRCQTAQTFTVTIASPAVFTTGASHGFQTNDVVRITTTGALPTGLTANGIYYVRNPSGTTFELSATSGGASINTSGTQSGTHTVTMFTKVTCTGVHGRSADDPIIFAGGTPLPTGITAGATYYVASQGLTTTELYFKSGTISNSLVSTTSSGSGAPFLYGHRTYLQEWQNSAGDDLVSIDQYGNLLTNLKTTPIRLGHIPADSNYSGIWFSSGAVSPSASNYSFLGDPSNTFLNGPTWVFIRTNNTNRLTITNGYVEWADAHDIVFNSTTGTKIARATNQKFAFHGSTPVIQRAGASQASVATTASTNITPYGFTTSSQADAIVTLVNEIRATLVEKGLMKGSA